MADKKAEKAPDREKEPEPELTEDEKNEAVRQAAKDARAAARTGQSPL